VFIHEAIIHLWTRLRQWVDDEREFLRRLQDVESDLYRWKQLPQGSKDAGLLMGIALAEAKEVFTARATDLPVSTKEFIQQSLEADARRRELPLRMRRRALHMTWISAALFGLVSFEHAVANGAVDRPLRGGEVHPAAVGRRPVTCGHSP
jgi:hypothetical protein